MAAISSLGVGSGLDIRGLVTQLVEAETASAAARIEDQQAEATAQLSAFGLLRSALSDLQIAASRIGEASAFVAREGESSDEDVFTVTTAANASRASFDVEVVRLASSHKLMTNATFTSASANVGTGDLTISVGGEAFQVGIGAEDSSLEAIRDAINGADDNTGVTAAVLNVDDGSGGTESRLILSSNETGESRRITVTVDDDDGDDGDAAGLSRLATGQLSEQSPTDLDAEIEIDGQTITRSSNLISDALDGVTLKLESADPGNLHTLSVSEDTSIAVDAVTDFVEEFNNVAEMLGTISSLDDTTGDTGVLFGDSTVRSLDGQLRSAMTDTVRGINGTLRSLSSLGITTGADGRLSIESADLAGQIDANLEEVIDLFTSDQGIAARVGSLAGSYVDFGGLLDGRTDGLEATLRSLETSQEQLTRRTDALESRLLAQFTAMDTLVAQLQNTGSFLDQQIDSLRAQTGR